jgi:hypothetical protein
MNFLWVNGGNMNIFEDMDEKIIKKHLDTVYGDVNKLLISWIEKNLRSDICMTMLFETVLTKMISNLDTKEIFLILSRAFNNSAEISMDMDKKHKS